MKMKCIVPRENHATLAVTNEVHAILKTLSEEEKLPISTITFYLLRLGLERYCGWDLTETGMKEIEPKKFN
jgi:hypothetical protein